MGFFTKGLSWAFHLLMSPVTLQKKRVYVGPKLTGPGTVFLEKCFAGPDTTSRNINLIPAPYPLCAPRFARGQVMEYAHRAEWRRSPKTLGSCPSPIASASLLQRSTPGPPLLPTQDKNCSQEPVPSPTGQPAQRAPQGVWLCGLHNGNVSPEWVIVPFNSELFSVPSVRSSGVKSLSHTEKKEYTTLPKSHKEFLEMPEVDSYYPPLTETLMIRFKITSKRRFQSLGRRPPSEVLFF